MRRTYLVALALLFTLLIPLAARGDVFVPGNFSAELDPYEYNQLNSGGGSGWLDPLSGKRWFLYEEEVAHSEPVIITWWNQWYYDGRFRPGWSKEVTINFDAVRVNPNISGEVFIAVNFTTPEWWEWETGPGGESRPPLPNDPNVETALVREVVARIDVPPPNPAGVPPPHFTFDWLIDEWNPDWVSIDVRGINASITNGVLVHNCVPEPATFIVWSLLGASGVGIGWLRRRRAG